MSGRAIGLDQALAAGRRWRNWGLWSLVALLTLYGVLAFSSAGRKSVTVDELGHLPSGLHYLTTGDPRYSSLNPPLVNALSALPVLFLGFFDLVAEPEAPPPLDDPMSFWSTGYHFLELHRADYLRMFAAARGMPVLIVAGLGVLLFVWGRRLVPEAPDAAGLLAAGFVCLSPNVLAHARIVGTDAGTAFFVTLALFALRGMLLRLTAPSLLLCGLALGLAQLTKFYALLLYPTLLGLAIAWHLLSPRPRPRLARLLGCCAGAVAVSLVVLNMGYLWQEFGASLSEISLRSAPLKSWQASAPGQVPLPLPAAYVRAFDGQLIETDWGLPSFLFGESFQGGRWYYYLALLAIKTPLPLLLVFGLALTLSFTRSSLPRRECALLVTYPLLLFVVLSFSGRRQLGVRALLSAVPFVQLWVAATLGRAWPEKRWPLLFGGAALLSTLAVSLWSYPNYLSYFNSLVGGSERGYLYASDSNVDIGQDLVQLAEYLEREGVDEIQLLYFGSVDPALYGIDYEVPTAGVLRPGLLAVSVSLYRMAYPMYDHGRLVGVGPVKLSGEPVKSIGGSIHVYRIAP